MILASLITTACAGQQTPVEQATQNQPQLTLAPHPDNKPGDDFDMLWGEKVPDPYRWLENGDDPEVQAWAAAQDKRAKDYLAQMPMRDWFIKRLNEFEHVPFVSPPNVRNNIMIYAKRDATDEKSITYVKDLRNPDAPERVLFDPNKLSNDGSVTVSLKQFSHDNRLMAYKLNKNNADQGVLHFIDIETGKELPDTIEAARYSRVAWTPDLSGFYYTRFPIEEDIPVDERPGLTDIRFHKFGTAESEDKVILGPLNDPKKIQSVSLSFDGHWMIHSIDDGWNGNALRLRDLSKDGSPWIDLPSKPDCFYNADIHNNIMFFRTNDGADKYKIVKIDLNGSSPDLSESHWQTLIPEFSDRVIEDYTIVMDKLFVVTIKDVVNYLDVYDLSGNHIKTIEMPDKGSLYFGAYPDEPVVYFWFSSYKVPDSYYKLDVNTLDVSLWSSQEVPFKPEDFVSEQLFATSKDGTKIPMFVLRHKDTKLDGTAKTIIFGYGGFSVSISPWFDSSIIPWLEKGGIYVYSILRGGGEYGEAWHQAGMRENKQNVFDDYYAVAEYLIEHKYTRRESLAAYGRSNGGILTGVALTQRPDLYRAVVCGVPLLDMIRFHKFGYGHVGTYEYGNAENSEQEYRTLRAYSPYANVQKINYPSVMFMSNDSDDRVDPMHARKMTAAVQDSTTSDNPVILRIEKNAGHSGSGLAQKQIENTADIYSFLNYVLK